MGSHANQRVPSSPRPPKHRCTGRPAMPAAQPAAPLTTCSRINQVSLSGAARAWRSAAHRDPLLQNSSTRAGGSRDIPMKPVGKRGATGGWVRGEGCGLHLQLLRRAETNCRAHWLQGTRPRQAHSLRCHAGSEARLPRMLGWRMAAIRVASCSQKHARFSLPPFIRERCRSGAAAFKRGLSMWRTVPSAQVRWRRVLARHAEHVASLQKDTEKAAYNEAMGITHMSGHCTLLRT